MYLEHFHLHRSPFAEEVDPDIFFPEAGRAEALAAMLAEVQSGKPLVKLIGQEGSGKTLLCRLIVRELSVQDYEVVYLDNPVGSFDDLLHGVCLDLGMMPSVEPEQNMLSVLRTLLVQRQQGGKRVLLIIDEAEKLFLAALERLMRAICEVGEERLLQVLLAGRPALDANLDQLTVFCSDVDIKGGGSLDPLAPDEVGRYLRFRLEAAGLPPDNQEEVFTEGAVSKIAKASNGNLRLINILAEEALQSSSSDKSFLVLLDHVASEEDQQDEITSRFSSFKNILLRHQKVLAGILLLLCVILGILFFGSGDQENNPVVDASRDAVVTQPEETTAVPVPSEPPEEVAVPARYEVPPTVEVTDREVEPPEDIAPPVREELPAESPKGHVIELRPDNVKKAPGEGKTRALTPASKKKQCPAPAGAVRAVNGSMARVSGEQLYQERIRASAKWLAGGYHNAYTVQLMMLASEQAATNLKKMLVNEDYCVIKNNLYILRKKTSPPTLFVFYGTYNSMEQARQARNNMPLFLRKHHPYALSINAAMKKTED